MTDQASPVSLADRALDRLRRIASGNGLEPAAIEVLEIQEQVFTIKGKLTFSPLCETERSVYPGHAGGKDAQKVGSLADLQSAVAEHQEEFRKNPDWIDAALQEVRAHQNEGWGLESAKVTLPQKSAVYVATETCPSCGGRKTLTCTQCLGKGEVICNQCQGKGREQCYYCNGRGQDPQQQDRACPTCNGTRFATCRFCQMRGHLPCPTCNGTRGTPCQTCRATGVLTQEIKLTCGAETHFTISGEGLPSGLRRGIDRIGIANLGKGHADISSAPITDQEKEEVRAGAPIPVLSYAAALPYAEIRMRLGAKKAVIAVTGKRCAISGVPHFLDASLQQWRDRLRLAAAGKAVLEEALEARALNDALSLCLAGRDRMQDFQRLYPFGLSAEAMNGILSDMRQALKQTTLKTRAFMAVLNVLVCAAFFYAFFRLGFEARLVWGQKIYIGLGIDGTALALSLAAAWASLNLTTRFVLKRRFPQLNHALQQEIGKTGYAMLGGIVVAFVIFLLLAPIKPALLALFAR